MNKFLKTGNAFHKHRKGAFSLKNKIRYTIIRNSKKLKMGLALLSAVMWVGASYPELCFTPYTCQMVMWKDGKEIPVEPGKDIPIWNLREEKIVMSSRLWEWLQEYAQK